MPVAAHDAIPAPISI